jgi:GTP-binding protein
MQIKNAEFVLSSVSNEKCPRTSLPEYAFIGRSNVGKSSLINMLVDKKNLAKTSSTPGKTQMINHFIINEGWYIADLPGYGYAKASKESRSKWDKVSRGYLLKRKNLLTTFVLIDARLVPQQNDLDFMEWMGEKEIPFVICFTKTDKLSLNEINQNTEHYKTLLKEFWEELPQMILTSSDTKLGKEEMLGFIEKTNKEFEEFSSN